MTQVLPLIAMGLALAVVCVLTALDPLARKSYLGAVTVLGWVVLCGLGWWRGAIIGERPAETALGAAALYGLVVLATLGRPMLLLTDLLEDDETWSADRKLKRRSRIAQAVVLGGIVIGVIAFT